MLPEQLMDDPPELRQWIGRAFQAAAALPAKAAKPAKKAPKAAKPPAAKAAPAARSQAKRSAKKRA